MVWMVGGHTTGMHSWYVFPACIAPTGGSHQVDRTSRVFPACKAQLSKRLLEADAGL